MNGIDCFFKGLELVRQPGLRRYVVIPLIINFVVLATVMTYGVSQYDALTGMIVSWLPDWLQFLSGVLTFLAAVIVFAIGIYLFTIVANIIASPFNALLAERAEEFLTGERPTPVSLWVVLPRSIGREIAKLLYLLPRLLGLVILSLIPLVNALAPFAWVLFGAWMMTIQYADYAADNNQLSFAELRRRLGANRVQAILFGILVYLVLAIPVINLFLIPVAVAGGTAFWVSKLRS